MRLEAAAERIATSDATRAAIHVCPLSAVGTVLVEIGASHLISIINLQSMIDTPPAIPRQRHLRLALNDITAPMPGLVHPAAEHVTRLVEFVSDWDATAPMLIHCHAGISRSTAGAYIALCVLNPGVPEAEIAHALRRASLTASPNRLMVSHADTLLGRDGRMEAAIEAIGFGEPAVAALAFSLPARHCS